MASEAAEKWAARQPYLTPLRHAMAVASFDAGYDAGAASVLERLERVCEEINNGPAVAAAILRRMREPA